MSLDALGIMMRSILMDYKRLLKFEFYMSVSD